MPAMIDFLFRALLSIAVGGLIGLERERGKKTPIVGMRTFALVSFLGFLVSFFSAESQQSWLVVGSGFAGVFILAILYYAFRVRYSYYARMSLGLTTTIVIPLAFFLGALIGWSRFLEAGVAAIACVYLLVEKKELREIGESITKQELLDLLTFIVIAFIIYPALPSNEVKLFGFWLNLQYFWFVVVVVSAISFAGHILAKHFRDKAVFYTAFLGGLVSSVATTAVFLKKTRDKSVLLAAITSAALASALSNAAVILLANPGFFQAALPVVAALTALYAAAAWWTLKFLRRGESIAVKRSAISLRFSVEFAAIFFIAYLAVSKLAASPGATVVFSFIGGLVSSTSVYAAVAYAFGSGALGLNAAVYSLVFASIGSLATKTALAALAVKDAGFTRDLALLFVLALAFGVTAAFLAY